jgi:hypothetical protein
MLGHDAARGRLKRLVASIFVVALIIVQVACSSAYSSSIVVSPGKYDLLLGDDFPSFGSVKLSYPDSAILTNSTGDLLFNVTLGLNSTTSKGHVSSVKIYVPPDFSGLSISKIWTSFTNNYDSASLNLLRLSPSDPIGPNWWEVEVSNLNLTKSTPDVAHRVFQANATQYVRLFQVTSPVIAGRYFFKAFINGTSVGPNNFPTLVVKASRDPAYISGVLRDLGDRNPELAGKPINLTSGYGARVLATGMDYLGRSVSAQTFINSTADGNYTLFGVAPGTYNLTAYAAGYIPATRPWTVSVVAAQSLEGVDIYLSESPIVTGSVLSTCDGAPVQWGSLTALSFGTSKTRSVPRAISVQVQTLDGVVVAQTPINATFTNPTATTFVFPTIYSNVNLDGRIPQDFANYTSGLTSGDYLMRAYVTSYVQLVEVRIHLLNESTDAQVVIPLVRTGSFFITVHFRDSNSTIVDSPISEAGSLSISAYDEEGILRAQNSTFVAAGSRTASIQLQGFSTSRIAGAGSLLPTNYGILPGTYYIVARFTAAQLFFRVSGGQDLYYQLSDVQGTLGLSCNANVSLSFSIYLAGGILLTIYPITYQIPPLETPVEYWRYPNATVQVTILDQLGRVYTTSAIQSRLNATTKFVNATYIGLLTGDYLVYVRTLGYTQSQLIHVDVRLGANSDAAVYMVLNPVINLTVAFREENLLTFIDSQLPYAQPINNLDATPVRLEVFDERGDFVSANATYIPNLTNGHPTNTTDFMFAGFDRYFGDPRLVWAGFYDTTDGFSQIQGGLFLYPWSLASRTFTIRIWIDGYYQLEPLRVVVAPPQNVSIVTLVDRASRVYGTVIGPDYFDIARHLSWATISLEPDNYTLTGIIDVRPGNYTTSSLDGSFEVWVPQGTYGMGVALEGYATYSTKIAVPEGSDMIMQIWLDNYILGQPAGIISTTVTVIPMNRPAAVFNENSRASANPL